MHSYHLLVIIYLILYKWCRSYKLFLGMFRISMLKRLKHRMVTSIMKNKQIFKSPVLPAMKLAIAFLRVTKFSVHNIRSLLQYFSIILYIIHSQVYPSVLITPIMTLSIKAVTNFIISYLYFIRILSHLVSSEPNENRKICPSKGKTGGSEEIKSLYCDLAFRNIFKTSHVFKFV